MNVKNAFIPAAGFGSRMGKVGEKLPKPLWPIFEKTMLELQVLKLQEMGFKKIFINTHYEHKRVSEHISSKFENVFFLYEKTILGSGGCFYNLKNHSEFDSDLVYVQNSDIFYFFNQRYIDNINEDDSVATLFLVNPRRGAHKEVVVENQLLVGISNMKEGALTYSGNGVVNVSLLKGREGVSGFFSSVANYENQKVRTVHPESGEYWDFGTKELFYNSIFEILNNSSSQMYKFLIDQDALSIKKQKVNAYSSELFSIKDSSIFLDSCEVNIENSICYGGICEKIT